MLLALAMPERRRPSHRFSGRGEPKSLNPRTPIGYSPPKPVVSRTGTDIERLLLWAYRDELSKRVTSSAEGIWATVAEIGWLGGIDPGHGTAQRYSHFGLPDPDAITIEAAISALPDIIIDWEASRDGVMGELAPLIEKRDVLLVRPFKSSSLVMMHAKMNTRPDWHSELPRAYCVPAAMGRGRPAIVGECRAKDTYTTGSYCPLRWSPSPVGIALARLDYAVWHRALCTLANTLKLDRHTALPPSAPARPWVGETEPERRIYSAGEKHMDALPLKPQRDVMGSGPPRGRNSSVRKIVIDR